MFHRDCHRTPSMKLDGNLEFSILLNRALLVRTSGGNNRIQNRIRVEESEAIYTMAERYELQSQSGKGKMPTVDRTPTGIPGLDEILSGGFPRGRVILLVGGPGTGKTILTSQFLMNGIKIYGENGAFVSLDETKAHYYREMALFGWKFEELRRAKSSRSSTRPRSATCQARSRLDDNPSEGKTFRSSALSKESRLTPN